MSKNTTYSELTNVNSSFLSNNRTIPRNEHYITALAIYYTAVIITASIAYAFIFISVYFNRRLRTICNFFIISLGVADAIIVTMVIPIHISLMRGTFRFYSVAHCRFITVVYLISVSAVSLNLCVVSMERYFAIAHPFKYEAFTTTKTTGMIIGGVWLYALLAALLPTMGWRSQPIKIRRNICEADSLESYTLFMTIGSFFIPAVIMCSSNFLVYRIATNQTKRVLHIVPAVGPRADLLRKNFRAAKRISFIVGAYLVCWMPQMVVLVIALKIGARNVPNEIHSVTLSMQYSCSAVNPCMFCFTNRELRKTLKKLFKTALGKWTERRYLTRNDNGMEMDRRRSTLGGISQTTDVSTACRGDRVLAPDKSGHN